MSFSFTFQIDQRNGPNGNIQKDKLRAWPLCQIHVHDRLGQRLLPSLHWGGARIGVKRGKREFGKISYNDVGGETDNKTTINQQCGGSTQS